MQQHLSQDGEAFVVEDLLATRTLNRVKYVLIKWRGYDQFQDLTWQRITPDLEVLTTQRNGRVMPWLNALKCIWREEPVVIDDNVLGIRPCAIYAVRWSRKHRQHLYRVLMELETKPVWLAAEEMRSYGDCGRFLMEYGHRMMDKIFT